MPAKFVHLHIHTEYSLLDGACIIDDLIEKAKELNMPALGITDHGNLYGAIEFYEKAQNANIKPIIGCEVYVAPRNRFHKNNKQEGSPYHLILLAKNKKGYENLIKLVSKGYLEGFYYKPRIDKELLANHQDGLICLSGCVKGEIPYLIINNEKDLAKKTALELKEIFKDNFYLEIQNQNLKEQEIVNEYLKKFSGELKIPLVATNDVHYLNKEESYAHDVLLCIQTQTKIHDKNRLRFSSLEFYFKSVDEMQNLFSEEELLQNTLKIASECNLKINLGEIHLPHFQPPKNYDVNEYLRELCFKGLSNRYEEVNSTLKERLDYELKTIEEKGLSSYFLILWDIVRYAKDTNIPVGPGRGSAAGSLVSYCLGITSIDPIKYGLLFERFINPERKGLPDIDLDFSDNKREKIIEYVVHKYGQDRVAQIITFGTMLARAAIRDVGRALDIPYQEVDKIAKIIPWNENLRSALENIPELKTYYESSEQNKLLIDTAKSLEGITRHASTHSAGIVISKESLTSYTPLQSLEEGVITTQYDMKSIEKIGLLKMDLLGLRTLSVIEETLSLIKKRRGIEIDLEKISLSDKKTYQLLSRGETIGVFQLESVGMRSLLKELRIDKFEEIIALLALYRPGPLKSGMVEDFIKRKRGEIPIKYLHESLEPILKDTYGVILYQEQVMNLANKLAGFTLSQADDLRKSMSKKIPKEMKKIEKSFKEGCSKNKIDSKIASKIFEQISYFAGYGFNKSHSAAYALLAYQTAYLKANYQIEYLCSLLNSVADKMDDVVKYIREAERLKIKILPPDINESSINFTIGENNIIRFGLSAIKNVGKAANNIIQSRNNKKFNSLEDFLERVDLRLVNKKVVESLIKAGTFDSLGLKRAYLLSVLENKRKEAGNIHKRESFGQSSLFEISTPTIKKESNDFEEFNKEELLAMEKDMLGLYISSHPLKGIENKLKKESSHTLSELINLRENEEVNIVGFVSSIQKKIDRKGGTMVFMNLEDLNTKTEVIVFSKVYEKFTNLIQKDRILKIKGKISKKERIENGEEKEEVKIIAQEISLPQLDKEETTKKRGKINIKIEKENINLLNKIKEIFLRYTGNEEVFLHLKTVSSLTSISLGPKYFVSLNEDLMKELEDILGKENVWVE